MKKVNRENIREINKSRKQGYKYKRNIRVYIIQRNNEDSQKLYII